MASAWIAEPGLQGTDVGCHVSCKREFSSRQAILAKHLGMHGRVPLASTANYAADRLNTQSAGEAYPSFGATLGLLLAWLTKLC